MRRSEPVLVCVLGMVAACVDGALPAPRAADDPSNPNAPEASLAPMPSVAPSDAGPAAPQQGPYTCPMHPDVVRDAPGSCPTCGMALVPASQAHPHHDAGAR